MHEQSTLAYDISSGQYLRHIQHLQYGPSPGRGNNTTHELGSSFAPDESEGTLGSYGQFCSC